MNWSTLLTTAVVAAFVSAIGVVLSARIAGRVTRDTDSAHIRHEKALADARFN